MIIDAHLHLEPELPASRLIETMNKSGIDAACLIAAAQVPLGPIRRRTAFFRTCMQIPATRAPLYRIATRFRPRPHVRPDNDSVFEAARANPKRFLPYVFLNPALGDEAHDELDRLLSDARGVKLHPWFHDYRLTEAIPILQRCERAGLPVLVHFGLGPPEDASAVMEACPKLKLILAHAGLPHFERLWRVERVLFDVASPRTLVSHRTIRALLEAVGSDRVVFASDGPTGLRVPGGGYSYEFPALPDRAMGGTMEALL